MRFPALVLTVALCAILPSAAAAVDEALASADRAFTHAVAQRQASALTSLLDRDFTWTDASGKTLDAGQVTRALPTAAIADEARAAHKQYDYPEVAVMQIDEGRLHGLRVWVKRPAGWRLLVVQEVRSLEAPPTVTPGTGKTCENPCGGVPYQPQSANQRAVIAAYLGLEEAAATGNATAWSGYAADELALVSSNSDRIFDKPTRVAAISRSTLGGVAPTRLLTARMFDFTDAVVMTSDHQPDRGDPLHITRVWVKRAGAWVETLSYQTAIRSAAGAR